METLTAPFRRFIRAVLTQSQHGFVAKAQQDLDQAVGRNCLPTYEDRDKLPYIEAIVEELLRWRPIASTGIPYRNMMEDTYQGHTISQGSIIIPNHWAIGRDESVYRLIDVDQFISERWLVSGELDNTIGEKSEVGAKLKDLPTIGFGYGRRICTDRHIARNSLWIQIARLLWAFNIEPAGGEEPDSMDCVTSILTMPLPLKAVFKPRRPEVIKIVSGQCDTWRKDIATLLDRIGQDRASKYF